MPAETTTHTGTTTHAGTTSRTPPGRTVALKGGGSASVRPNGQIRSINRNDMRLTTGCTAGEPL